MSKKLNAPEWLNEVMIPTKAAWDGVKVWEYDDVKNSILAALQRYESERPARRPWIDRTCENCAYWWKIARTDGGECRVNPPVIDFTSKGDPAGVFPSMRAADWCGKHQTEEEDRIIRSCQMPIVTVNAPKYHEFPDTGITASEQYQDLSDFVQHVKDYATAARLWQISRSTSRIRPATDNEKE